MDLEFVLFFLLALVFILGIPIAVVALIVSSVRLGQRVASLETAIERMSRPVAPVTAPRAPPPLPEWRPASERQERLSQEPPPEQTPEKPQETPLGASQSPPSERPSVQPPGAEPPRPPEGAEAPPPRDVEAAIVGGWFVWIAAAALALAGVFLVRHAIDEGWLTPWARVATGLGLGAVLLVAAEWLRQRALQEEAAANAAEGARAAWTRRLPFQAPAALATGGVSALFAAILAARHLYDLIGPEMGFVGMGLASIVAMGFGWVHGPILAGIGLLGGYATPLLVGGSSEGPAWLTAYLLSLTVACYGVERFKQWGWVAWSAMGAMAAWSFLLVTGYADIASAETGATFMIAAPIWAAAAVIAPGYGWPILSTEARPGLAAWVWGRQVSVPALLALVGVTVAAAVLALAVAMTEQTILGLAGFAALIAFTLIALRRAQVLDEAAPIVVLAASAGLLFGGGGFGSWDPRDAALLAESWSASVTLAFLAPLLIGLVLYGGRWRAELASGRAATLMLRPLYWTAVAVFGSLSLYFGFYLGHWDVLPSGIWASGAVALAALFTSEATRAAHLDGADKGRVSVYALGVFAALAGAAGTLFAGAPLTLALSALTAAAVLLDRRFELPSLSYATQVGAAVLGVRLLAWPGVPEALEMSLGSLWLAYPPAAAGCAVAAAVLAGMPTVGARLPARMAAESGAVVLTAAFLSILARRAFAEADTTHSGLGDWDLAEFAVYALVWGMAALAQLYRAGAGGPLRRARLTLATISGGAAALALAALLGPANPVMSGVLVGSVPILDKLALAYLAPAALLVIGAVIARAAGYPRLRAFLGGGAGLYGLLWALLETRRLWQGPDLSLEGVSSGELYSYSVVLLAAAMAFSLIGVSRGLSWARRAGLALAAAAIVKVFFIDIAGLDGLWRAASFLGLGLALVGLAWAYRKLEAARPVAG
ncbi:MAG: DUF2339 domain-containing protein [Rhodobacteraceae bacterium]|nr:DUF2339 domain-containing protein [Paracoccaceae bacterium]